MQELAELRESIISKVMIDADLIRITAGKMIPDWKIAAANKAIKKHCNIDGLDEIDKIILERNIKIIMG